MWGPSLDFRIEFICFILHFSSRWSRCVQSILTSPNSGTSMVIFITFLHTHAINQISKIKYWSTCRKYQYQFYDLESSYALKKIILYLPLIFLYLWADHFWELKSKSIYSATFPPFFFSSCYILVWYQPSMQEHKRG